MPLPHKNPEEDPKKFISRCMQDGVMNSEYPDGKQRYAVCNSLLERAKKKSKADVEPEWDAFKAGL